MRKQERNILEALDRLVHRAGLRGKIVARAARAERTLAARPDAPLAWETLPLGWFGRRLPGGVRSAWVFVLRARTNSGAERHPNSLQRTFSWRGAADFQTLGRAGWRSHRLASDSRAGLATRWLSIPPGAWHRAAVGRRNWVVVSFHTAPAKKLIEERPDPKAPGHALRSLGEGGRVRRRIYLGKGTGKRPGNSSRMRG
jgi:hypothetical protein